MSASVYSDSLVVKIALLTTTRVGGPSLYIIVSTALGTQATNMECVRKETISLRGEASKVICYVKFQFVKTKRVYHPPIYEVANMDGESELMDRSPFTTA